jgi:hypothetical protein
VLRDSLRARRLAALSCCFCLRFISFCRLRNEGRLLFDK